MKNRVKSATPRAPAKPERARPVAVLSSMTLRDAGIKERVEAAAAAGFDGIGLRADDYIRARAEGWTDAGLCALLADHGLWVTEAELLRSWGVSTRVIGKVVSG